MPYAWGIVVASIATLLATAPILPHMNTSFLGLILGDQVVFAWDTWWVHKALHDPNCSLWFCDYIFYPEGVSLANHTLMPLHSIWLGELMPKVGVFTCVNLLTLLSTWLTCFAVFLFALELGMMPLPATACMVVFGLSSFRVVELSGGHINVAMLEGVIFQALFLLRLLKRGGWANGFAFALFMLYTGWTEKMHLVFAVALDVAIVAMHWKELRGLRRMGRAQMLLPIVIVFAGIAPLIWLSATNPAPFPKEPSLIRDAGWFFRWLTGKATFAQARSAVKGSWGSAGAESADLLNFIGIEARNPFHPPISENNPSMRMPPRVFVGYTTLSIVFLSLLLMPSFRVRSKGWLSALICFSVLCLGPLLQVAGRVLPLPLPYAFMHYIPLLNQMRAPYRFASLTSLCAGVLVGMAFDELLKRWRRNSSPLMSKARHLLFTIASLLILAESLSWWWRLKAIEVQVPAFFQRMESGDFTLLEIPLGRWGGIASIGIPLAESVLYQCFHGKRLVGGVVSREHVSKVRGLLKERFFADLLSLQEGKELKGVRVSRGEAMKTLRRLNIRYIVVYRQWIGSQVHLTLLRSLPLKLCYRDRQIVAYEVQLPSIP